MEQNKAQTTDRAETDPVATQDPMAVQGGVDADTADHTTDEGADAGTEGKESVNDAEFVDYDSSGTDDGNRQEDRNEKNHRAKEQNAENARRRREAERQKELREAREKAIIDTLNGKNPYTGEEMKDSADVEEFLMMREIENNGGDPVGDYSKYRKERDRNAAQERAERESKEDWYRKDFEAFCTKYPNVNPEAILSDARFRDYAEGKVGVKPLADIYTGYLQFVSDSERQAEEIAAQQLANRNASPGSLRTTHPPENDYFTPEDVRKMSPAEVKKNYEKIRKSMKKW